MTDKIKLNHVRPNLVVSPKIAIVGSSGRLRDEPQGELIDTFEDVVRFNRAPTKNWEKQCGSKTTIHMANSHVFVGKPLQRGEWVQRDTGFIKRMKNKNIIVYGNHKFFARRNECVHKTSKAFQIDPQLNHILKPKLKLEIRKQLTVGMMFMAICIDSGIVPHIFGFDIEEERPRDHYWEERGPASKFHTPSDEKLVLRKLIEAGKIIFH